MSRIKESGLKAQDIVLVIDAIKGSRITMLKYRDLIIHAASTLPGEWPSSTKPSTPTAGTPSPFNSVLNATVSDSEEMSEEDRMELLKIEDPEEYERLLLAGELEDEQA